MRFLNQTLLVLAVAFTGCGEKAPWEKRQPEEEEPAALMQQRRLEDAADLNSTLTNLHQIIQALNLAQAHAEGARGQGLTIAVLDNGFAGLTTSLGTRLPPDLRIEPAPENDPANEPHGTKMAEIVYAVATGSVNYSPKRPGPKLLLYNTNGFRNLTHAIDEVIRRDVDIVLYAQIWEYGGNMDGKGFINAHVNRATAAGVLWVNAAGNYDKSAYSGPVRLGAESYVTLPFQKRYVRLNILEPTPVKISLGWNDFTDSIDYRTLQDLDLEIYDASGTKLTESKFQQDGKVRADDNNSTAHAREVIRTELPTGQYRIAVKARSDNFRDDSRLWIAVNGPHLEVLDSGDGNTIFIPADNPNVLTVGASDVDFSSKRPLKFGAAKPEMANFSHVNFDNGESFAGTSAASAISVGALAVISTFRYGTLSKSLVMDLLYGGHISSTQLSQGDADPITPVLRLP